MPDRKSFVFASLMLLLSFAAQAQNPKNANAAMLQSQAQEMPLVLSAERRAKILEMLEVTGTEHAMTETLADGRALLRSYARRETVVPGLAKESAKPISPAEEKLSSEYVANLDRIADTEFGWESMSANLLRFCNKNFTDDQLNGIVAFYRSPAGMAMLEKGQQLNQIARGELDALQNRLAAETERATKEYIAKRDLLHPPAAAASIDGTSSTKSPLPEERVPLPDNAR